MSYHREEEVARLIENAAQWAGDGAPVKSSASIWQRILRDTRKGSGVVATVGIDAGYTHHALAQIGEQLASALVTYHTSSLTVTMQAREILHISRRTFQNRLTEGHVAFMRAYWEARVKTVLGKRAPSWFEAS